MPPKNKNTPASKAKTFLDFFKDSIFGDRIVEGIEDLVKSLDSQAATENPLPDVFLEALEFMDPKVAEAYKTKLSARENVKWVLSQMHVDVAKSVRDVSNVLGITWGEAQKAVVDLNEITGWGLVETARFAGHSPDLFKDVVDRKIDLQDVSLTTTSLFRLIPLLRRLYKKSLRPRQILILKVGRTEITVRQITTLGAYIMAGTRRTGLAGVKVVTIMERSRRTGRKGNRVARLRVVFLAIGLICMRVPFSSMIRKPPRRHCREAPVIPQRQRCQLVAKPMVIGDTPQCVHHKTLTILELIPDIR